MSYKPKQPRRATSKTSSSTSALFGRGQKHQAAKSSVPRIAVVDDDPALLSLFKELSALGHFELVGTFSTASDALAHLPKCHPDLVFMDIRLPDISGLECTERLTTILPQLRVIVLTGHPDNETFVRALMAGANGFLIKPCGIEEILKAMRDVLNGGVVLGKDALTYLTGIVHSFRRLDPGHHLTEREKQILAGIFAGQVDKEIAGTLGIGFATVRTYLNQLFKKMKVHSKRELVAKFLKAAS
jgi:two-component system nitrate/nitrite response regulator NarL